MAETLARPAGQDAEIIAEAGKLKRGLTLLPLAGLIYFTVCGGTFGIEPLVGSSGPGLSLLMMFVIPIIFSIPIMLMVNEMTSMMPREGGYYYWIKQAFGPFAGFLAGWMNWVVSWVDVSIYPVLAAAYVGFFVPQLNEGMSIGTLELSGPFLSFLFGAVMIWLISLLQVRGARLTGLTTNWLGAAMLLPVIAMAAVAAYNWLSGGATPALPFMPEGQTLTGAFSLGLYVAMWNFMGFELATVAGDEIVNPKRTYPAAMVLVLALTIATYFVPVSLSLVGGAGEDGRYLLWGLEAMSEEETVGTLMAEQGVDEATLTEWGADPESASGWYLPEIAYAVGARAAGADSPLANGLGATVTIAAALSMIGLFIGNSLGGSRLPFVFAEDGMMPKWLVKVHPRYGTPWVSILVVGVIYTVFATNAFESLVIVDVTLNTLVLIGCFFALWRLRATLPNMPRKKVPGGYVGLFLVTLGPVAVMAFAIYSQIVEEGGASPLLYAAGAMVVGALLYFPLRKLIKEKYAIPDVDPFTAELEEVTEGK